ncbi:MAG: acyl-CoA dehydrogenase [Epsilonproteobacteria bacterium]|nr:MAG: acyl-CoA dehydrogenase [Campylobacterota bacterium]RLA67365.1 MAG: acyl-CoA dehydrogenase [Campylobacterota bacterium]
MENDKFESVVGNSFYGEIEENRVFPYPAFSAEQSEMAKEFINAFDKLAATIDYAKMDEEAKIPEEVYQGLAELGLYGMGIPEEYGGLNLDYSLYCRVFAQVCQWDGSLAVMLGGHQAIGLKALLLEGTDEQKSKWLPRLASGECLAAFCLTEPGSGSDAYSIKTKATKNDDGTYTIKGQKLWITNGGRADFYTMFCKTDHEKNGKKVEKITAFIVEKGMEGLSFGKKEDKMGIRASETRSVYLDNVKVPAENILGAEGKGFKLAMNILNDGRLSLGAGCAGGMKTLMKMATMHAKNRRQFDRPIAEFGLIQEKLAKMAANIYTTESMVYMTSGNMCRGMQDYYLESALCKVYGSEALWECVDMGLQIAAGNGYMKEYPYERLMRDSRINLIFEGTNEILRAFVALSGLKGPSESLAELGKISDVSTALKDPIKSLGVLTNFAKKRLSKMIGGNMITKHHPEFNEMASKLSGQFSDFALQAENALLKYKAEIIENELPLKRIANMAMELYASLSIISRTTSILNDDNIPQEKKDYCLKLGQFSLRESYAKFKKNLKEMNKNMDSTIKSLSDDIVKNEGYGLDIIDF